MAEADVLHSEIVDLTSLWRLQLRTESEPVPCKVVFRCAVLRGGAEVWVAGCYTPHDQNGGPSTLTDTQCVAARGSKDPLSNPGPPRKRRARGQDVVRDDQSRTTEAVPVPEADSFVQRALLHEEEVAPSLPPLDHSLLEQLHATSTEEVLRLLDEETTDNTCDS